MIRTNAQDPTETKSRRKTWARQYRGRWRDARGANRSWLRGAEVRDSGEFVSRYRTELTSILREHVVEPSPDRWVRRGNHWTGAHVRAAYRKGLKLARSDLKAAGYEDDAITAATREEHEDHKDRIHLLYMKAFSETEDAVDTVKKFVVREVSEALRGDPSMSQLVTTTNDEMTTRGENATNALANTLTIESVNEALLKSFELIGAENVGIQVESPAGDGVATNVMRVNEAGEIAWRTAMDDRVCEECMALEGRVLRIPDVQDSPQFQPPIHPNCRCRFIAMPMES